MILDYFEPDIEYTEQVEQAIEKLEVIYDALNNLEDTWCYFDFVSNSDAVELNESGYYYIFTFSHQLFFFDVCADLNNNVMYFRDKLNFLYDEKQLTSSRAFGISNEEFLENLKMFMAHNKLKHGLEMKVGNLNIGMLVSALEAYIKLELPMSYYDDEKTHEDFLDIIDFFQEGTDKHRFEIFNDLFETLMKKKFKHEIVDGDFVELNIYFGDALMEWVFTRLNRRMNLVMVTMKYNK